MFSYCGHVFREAVRLSSCLLSSGLEADVFPPASPYAVCRSRRRHSRFRVWPAAPTSWPKSIQSCHCRGCTDTSVHSTCRVIRCSFIYLHCDARCRSCRCIVASMLNRSNRRLVQMSDLVCHIVLHELQKSQWTEELTPIHHVRVNAYWMLVYKAICYAVTCFKFCNMPILGNLWPYCCA